MPVKQIITKGKVPVKIYTDEIESSAYQQLCQIAELPFIPYHLDLCNIEETEIQGMMELLKKENYDDRFSIQIA